ncbi:hypothetical protein GALMADRAFT_235381 [Galerina marginata CBS 339.88]|uniref:Heterokaryon incompatibility domain-containing protein n=1 Tax=Galerina marginata (strain CBS 339.88) TaxID=685588 RepID=A0A067U1I2_GALM3|nr:hypothetical protein GALMADRAFT_235381 [Galerina marginata CBS 339.88]
MSFWNCKSDAQLRQDQCRCGQVKIGQTFVPRCRAFKNAFEKIDAQVQTNKLWWAFLQDRPDFTTTVQRNEAEEHRAINARPGFCYLNGKLVPGDQVHEYIAVSYVWDSLKVWKEWCGREVTEQALKIAERLSKNTTLPLWIDALCIPQNDDLSVKMAELAKMSDIYRGATLVLCLLPEVSLEASTTVAICNALMDNECYTSLQGVDIYGSFMFATLGEHTSLRTLFGGRWWERAWTFQEAVLNLQTFLVGNDEQSIPIHSVFRLADPIQRRAATIGPLVPTMGKPASFWDSVSKMTDAPMPVGDAMSCVWRRDASIEHDMVYSLLGVCSISLVKPDYNLPLREVLMQLFESASSQGDYSWSIWCHGIDHDEEKEGSSIVPTPDKVRYIPYMSITKWQSSKVGPIAAKPGADKGILLPYRSTGVVRWESLPQRLPEMVKLLRTRSFKNSEIWDLVFGMRIGLCVDINRNVNKKTLEADDEGIAGPLLDLAMMMMEGSCSTSQDILDLAGEKPQTETLGFSNFSAMAAYIWKKDQNLIALTSQGGTIVIPENSTERKYVGSRIHLLPFEYGGIKTQGLITPLVAFVSRADAPFKASTVGVLIQKRGSSFGSWQVRRMEFGG